MKFRIRGIETDVSVTTITLEYNPNIVQKDSPEGLLLWHCPICCSPLFQFSGRMVSITPGMVPSRQPPIIKECPKCGVKYLLVNII